jgi:hypothetical protein
MLSQNRPANKWASGHLSSGWRSASCLEVNGRNFSMHASLAFVNGAGQKPRAAAVKSDPEGLRLLNALLSTATGESSGPSADKGKADRGKSKDEEVRERHLKKTKQ